MRTCERCDGELMWTSADKVKLFGGVHVYICPPCQTDWSVHIRHHDSGLWDRVVLHNGKESDCNARSMAQMPPSLVEWQGLAQEEQALIDEAFIIAQEFVTIPITRTASVEEPS